MKIAILTSGILPVPAVQGGAVETLTDFYLDYNNRRQLHDITVYSVGNSLVKAHPALQSEVNHYHFVDVNSPLAKIQKRIENRLSGGDGYYHYTIEYYLTQSLKHIAKEHYDMIILENRPGYSLRMKDIAPAKIVYHMHNDTLNADSRRGSELYERADRIITVSDYIRDRVKTIDAAGSKCVTVYNGIDLTAFSPKSSRKVTRSSLRLNATDFVLVYSGRITPEKGIKELIKAMTQLSEYPDIKLLVLGSSFYGNANTENPFVEELKEEARTLADRIIFTGFVPYAEMPDYLALADCAVVPSVWDDPFPTSVLEAMASSLPVITTQRGGIPEEVSTDNAILLPTGRGFVNKLTVAILELYSHPDRRERMALASQALSLRYGKDRFAGDFFDALIF